MQTYINIAFAYYLVFFCVLADGATPFNFNVSMMEATCKIEGGGGIGTGLIMVKAHPSLINEYHYVLVTADHVLANNQTDKAILTLRIPTPERDQRYMRMGVSVSIRSNGVPLWKKQPEVDLAAMFVELPAVANIKGLPLNMLIGDKEMEEAQIGPGSEVLCLGYPLGAESSVIGFPILRSGRIASYPIVPTEFTKTSAIDFEVFPGNSGGPVYICDLRAPHPIRVYVEIRGIIGIVTSQQLHVLPNLGGGQALVPLKIGNIIH